MLTFILDLILGGLLSLALFIIGLFPVVDVEAFRFAAPDGVRDALGTLNWFVPISDMMAIFGTWLLLVLVLNAAVVFAKLTRQGQEFTK